MSQDMPLLRDDLPGALMLPSVIDHEYNPSPGEPQLFEMFRTDPGARGWVVLHSLDIARHATQESGEADFVIIVPELGVLVLEVKAHHSVRRPTTDGLWRLGGDPPDPIGPFKQAARNMRSILQETKARDHTLSNVLMYSAVCFTNVPFSGKDPGWHTWQVIDQTDLQSGRSISDLVTHVLNNARRHVAQSKTGQWFDAGGAAPTAAQVARLVEILRGKFESYQSPKARRARNQAELKHYTEEQFEALDNMALHDQVLFEGAAGTGKSLLAREQARRWHSSGRRVLLCCYNRLLNESAREEMATSMGGLTVATIDELMLKWSGLPGVPPGAGSDFWTHELPGRALDALVERDMEDLFDALVVDEAQDLLAPQFLDVFDFVLKGSLAEGTWAFFGDPHRQALFESVTTLDEIAEGRTRLLGRHRAPFQLTVNCRNLPRLAEFASQLSRTEMPKKCRRQDDLFQPAVRFYSSEAEGVRVLADLLEEIQGEGISLGEVVILSPKKQGLAAALPAPIGQRIRPLGETARVHPRSGTVQAFKGLDAYLVIVTDVRAEDAQDQDALLYTALTRARDRLYVLAEESARPLLLARVLDEPESGS